MKYCSHCGAEVNNEAVVCIKCGCAIPNSNTQVVGIINPNDAPNKGFAVLSFFFPLIGLILWIVWNNSSPKKAKSCGTGALIGFISEVILIPAIIFLTIFLSTFSVIASNLLNKGGKDQTVVNSPYEMKSPEYAYYTLIGPVTIKTKDPASHSATVEMIIGYDMNDNAAQTELISRQYELRDFVRTYFSEKYAAELEPDNETRLKKEIMQILNDRFLDRARVRVILFNKLDVMEIY